MNRRWAPLATVVVALAAGIGLMMALFGRAPATAGLLSASPADNGVLPRPPRTVHLTFGGDLVPGASHLTVVDDRGGSLAAGPPVVADRSVDLPVRITAAGRYQVGYHVTLVDHGELTGRLSFRVASGGPAGPVDAPPDSSAHVHNARLDPITAVVLGADGLGLVIIAGKVIRRRARSVGTSGRSRRTIPS